MTLSFYYFCKFIVMKRLLIYNVFLLILMSCGANKQFTAQDNQAYQQLQDLVASRSFEIVSTSARPIATAAFTKVANSNILGPGNSAGNIDITSNSNKLTIKGDSISGYLPYFGEQTFGGGYGGNHTGIEFKDLPKDYQVIHNDKKHFVTISFNITDQYRKSDNYAITITLYPSYRSHIRVQSTSRTSIEYSGRVSTLEDAKQ